MRFHLVLGVLLMVSGCTGADPWLRTGTTTTTGAIARDARGEPVLDGITTQPAPVETPPPARLAHAQARKQISCQHFRRCL